MKLFATASFVVLAGLVLMGAVPVKAAEIAPAAGAKNEQGLTAVIVAGKDTYTLDPGQSGKEFRDMLDQRKNGRGGGAANRGAGGRMGAIGSLPPPPAVDLTLRITNTTDKDVTINVGGDDSQMQLKLVGPGAVTMDNQVAMTMEFRIGKPVVIAAGKSYEQKITSLAFGSRGISQYAYWTEAGDYTLTATLVYGTGDGKPQGKVESAAAKIKVEAAK